MVTALQISGQQPYRNFTVTRQQKRTTTHEETLLFREEAKSYPLSMALNLRFNGERATPYLLEAGTLHTP